MVEFKFHWDDIDDIPIVNNYSELKYLEDIYKLYYPKLYFWDEPAVEKYPAAVMVESEVQNGKRVARWRIFYKDVVKCEHCEVESEKWNIKQ